MQRNPPSSLKFSEETAKLASFRDKLLRRKSLNTLLSQHFEQHKDAESLEIPVFYKTNKICLFFNVKCESFPQCFYDLQEIVETFARLNHQKNTLFPCRGCQIPLKFKFFFRDSGIQEQIDAVFKEFNAFPSEKCCFAIKVARNRQITPLFARSAQIFAENQGENEDFLENYPPLSRFSLQNLQELLFLFEKYVRNKEKDLVLAEIYGISLKNRDLQALIDDFKVKKSVFRVLLAYFSHSFSSEIAKRPLIFVTFNEKAYKLDEFFGNMRPSAELLRENAVNFLIKSAISSKFPKFFAFCECFPQKSLLKVYIPDFEAEKIAISSKISEETAQKLIAFVREQLNFEANGLILTYFAVSDERNRDFALFFLYFFKEMLGGRAQKLDFSQFRENFYWEILWFLLNASALKTVFLRKDVTSPKSSPKLRRKFANFQENVKLLRPFQESSFGKRTTSHEICWKTGRKPDIFANSLEKRENFEIFPTISAGNKDFWPFARENEGKYGKNSVFAGFLETNESVPLENPGKSQESSKNLAKIPKIPKNPWEIPSKSSILSVSNEKPAKNVKEITNIGELRALLQAETLDFEDFPGNSLENGVNFKDFSGKRIKISKKQLISLLKQLNFSAKFGKPPENREKMLEIPKKSENSLIFEELGPANPHETRKIGKKQLQKLLFEEEERVLARLLEEERENFKENAEKYEKMREFLYNQLNFEYLLGYYYYNFPETYAKLRREFEERLENKRKIQEIQQKTQFNHSEFAKKPSNSQETHENDDFLDNFFPEIAKTVEISSKTANFLGKQHDFFKKPRENSSYPAKLLEKPEKSQENAGISLLDAGFFANSSTNRLETEYIAQFCEISITKQEFQRFRSTGFLTENMLNFLINYFENKHIFRLKQDFYSVDFRILCFDTTFMQKVAENAENAEDFAVFPGKTHKKRNIFQQFDVILLPFFLTIDHCVMISLDFRVKRLTFFDNLHDKRKSPRNCSENPYVQRILAYFDKKFKEKYLKPSSFYQWTAEFSEEIELLPVKTKTTLMIARYIYVSFNMRGDFRSDGVVIQDFQKRLCEFFMGFGFHKEKIRKEKLFIL